MPTAVDTPYSEPSTPQNGWQLFFRLASGALMPGKVWKNPAYRRKFVLRTLLTPVSTALLLKNLVRQPQLLQMLRAQPELPCRMHRPWLSINMNRQQTLAALESHYQILASRLPSAVFNGYLSEKGYLLATLSGKNEQTFTLHLWTSAHLNKEGEATLVFCDRQQTVLAALTFACCHHQQKNTLYIGGLQGGRAHTSHQVIQDATKACYGLFPKRLLVEALMTLGAQLSVEQILAVSNSTHIYRSLRYRRKKKSKLHADYDSFWLSLGGEQNAQRDFRLPLTMPRKSVEEIASKKRAAYRLRYALLDELTGQIRQICAT